MIFAFVLSPPIRKIGCMAALPDFLRPLEFAEPPFPEEAIAAALARPEESVPHLLNALKWVEQNAEEANESEPLYMLHLHALFILAQLRETRALPLVIKLFRHEDYDALTADIVVDGLPRILASICGGDVDSIKALIEDQTADVFVRCAGITSLAVLLHTGTRSREEISAYFGELFAGRLEQAASLVYEELVIVCVDLRLSEHLNAIERVRESGFADSSLETMAEIRSEITLPPQTSPNPEDSTYEFISDAAAEMADCECYDPDASTFSDDDSDFESVDAETATAPVVREAPKVGRNDLCPCGSGKKYKKCCGK